MRLAVFAFLVLLGAFLLFLGIAVLHPMLALVLCVCYSVLSAGGYAFFKEKEEAGKRRPGLKKEAGRARKKREEKKFLGLKKEVWLAAVSFAGVSIGLFLALGVYTGETTSGQCPEKILGNSSAPVVVKYFYSPFCSHCVGNEGLKEEFARRNAAGVRFEQYDVRNCWGEAEKYEVFATPCYVFLKEGRNLTECGALPLAELESILERA